MSSFRIDRQYVSFITAETRSVYPTAQIAHTNTLFSDTESVGRLEYAEEMERQCAEILENAKKDAEKEAALILEQAKSDADTITKKAKRLAGETAEGARTEAAAIREEAKRTGYSEGKKAAQMDAEAKRSKEEKEFSRLMEELRGEYAGLMDSMRGDVISLVIDIVKKVINFKLSESDELFMGLVSDALDQLKQTGATTIHVSSEDYARYFGKEPAKGSVHIGKTETAVMEENGYSPGDLVVESEGEMLDFSIGRQIDRVEKAFLKEGN